MLLVTQEGVPSQPFEQPLQHVHFQHSLIVCYIVRLWVPIDQERQFVLLTAQTIAFLARLMVLNFVEPRPIHTVGSFVRTWNKFQNMVRT